MSFDKLSSVAIVVLCTALVGDIIHRNITRGSTAAPTNAAAPSAAARSGNPTAAAAIAAGAPKTDRIPYSPGEAFKPVAGFSPSPGKASLVLVVKDGCPFCTASMPFYQKMSAKLQHARSMEFVGVCPQEEAMCNAYLKSHDLTFTRTVGIASSVMADMRVLGTPTIMLIGETGKVENVWLGKLTQQREDEVVAAIDRKLSGH